MYRIAVLTASDRSAAGQRDDTSGVIAVEMLREMLGEVQVLSAIVPDDRKSIEDRLRIWCDGAGVALVVTSGGTGIAPRDVTPQATAAVVDYQVPGLAEMMRAESFKHTPMAALSRAIAGVRGKTLIINLPGSPRAVRECLTALAPVLPHALEQLESGRGH